MCAVVAVLLKSPRWPARVRSSRTKRCTFGLDALFREFKIYAPFGQQYEPSTRR